MKYLILIICVYIIIFIIKTIGPVVIVRTIRKIKYKIKGKQTKNINKTIEEKIDFGSEKEKLPYRKKLLLTKNEWSFYKSLKPIADELQLTVLSKIRVADLVEPIPNRNQSEWQKYFNKINRKHVDFALAKPENLQIMLLIELDDSTHDADQKQRDEFIEALYTQTGYNFIRVRGSGELKQKIENALNKEKPETTKEKQTEENVKPPIIIKK